MGIATNALYPLATSLSKGRYQRGKNYMSLVNIPDRSSAALNISRDLTASVVR
jgi:hypothetical protein